MTLKLYVWEEVFCDYSCGIAVALAEDIEQAWKLLKASVDYFDTHAGDNYTIDGVKPMVYEYPTAFHTRGGS